MEYLGEGGKLGSLPTPSRDGYTFDGCYTEQTGGERVTDSTVYTKNTTLYAHWTNNGGNGSSNDNGGNGSSNDNGGNGSSNDITKQECTHATTEIRGAVEATLYYSRKQVKALHKM